MMGTIVNVIAIVVGSFIGLVLKKGLPRRVEEATMQMIGLGVFVVGMNGTLTSMLSVDAVTGKIVESGGIMLIISLVVGGVVGELLNLEERISSGGMWIERRIGAQGFAKGFIAASILFSVGAMSTVGALTDGLSGDSSILYIKSTLDGITSIILSASLGIGVVFSAVTVFVYQGTISLFASSLSGVFQGAMLVQFCMTGFAIVMVIGTNLMGITKYKTSNMIPAMLVPVLLNSFDMLKIL